MMQKEKQIKLCGLKTIEDIDAVNRFKPDYAGFVFAPGKRQISPSKAFLLRKALIPEISAVGVFVNSPVTEILALVRDHVIDAIQLHGEEDETYIRNLKQEMQTSVPIIKAIRIKEKTDFHLADSLSVDFLLFDTYCKGIHGGSGKTFDWTMIPAIKKPYFLAGGIEESNLYDALKTNAFCLDISTGVETEGKKDPDKIRNIIQLIRSKTSCQKEDLDGTADSLSLKR